MPHEPVVVSNQRISEILCQARQKIKDNGWCQGAYHSGNSSCMLGAISRAAQEGRSKNLDGRETIRLEFDAASNFLRSFIGERIPAYNDHPCRTKKEVLAKLHEASVAACKA